MNITTIPFLMMRRRTDPARSNAVDAIETLRFVSFPCLSISPATKGWKITERTLAKASVIPISVFENPFSSRKTDAYAWIPLYTAKYVALIMMYLNVQNFFVCDIEDLIKYSANHYTLLKGIRLSYNLVP